MCEPSGGAIIARQNGQPLKNADSAVFELAQTFKDDIEWSSVESVMFLQQRPQLYSLLNMPNFTKTEKLNF